MSQIYRFTLRTYQDVTIRFPNGWTQADVARHYKDRPDEIKKLVEEWGNITHDDEIEFLGFEHEMELEDVEGVPNYNLMAPLHERQKASQGGA